MARPASSFSRPARGLSWPARSFSRLGVALLCVPACTGLEVSESALVVLDDEARRAGITVEIEGEPQDTEHPIAVPTRGDVSVRRGQVEEPLSAAAGELIAIEGAEGRVRHGLDAEQLVIDADAQRAAQLAELGGLRAIPLPDGRYLIDGENAGWTALLFPELAGTVSPWSASGASPALAATWLSPEDASWAARSALALEPEDVIATAPPTDLAAYVGAYVADDVVLVLDAAGGMHMTARGLDRRGTFGLDARGGLVLLFEDGRFEDGRSEGVAVERTADEGLRDATGVHFRTMPVPTPITGTAQRPGTITLVHEGGL